MVRAPVFISSPALLTPPLGQQRKHKNCFIPPRSWHSVTPFFRTQLSTTALLNSSERRQTPSPSKENNEQSFQELYADSTPGWLLPRLNSLGFKCPTPVQLQTLDVALPKEMSTPGRDVLIHAQTGSGKTLAYLIPMIAAINPLRACTQGLIIVPTQELGMQVYKLLRRVVSAYPHGNDVMEEFTDTDGELNGSDQLVHCSFPVLPMLNQADFRRQKLQLRKSAPRVIVGNPKRLAKLVDSGRLRLDLVKVLVVDEFDACLLDTDTTRALQTILSVRGREGPRQTILASATVPQHRHFLRQCVRQRWTRADIKHIWVEQSSREVVPPSLRHSYAVCEGPKKLAALRTLLIKFGTQQEGDLSGKYSTKLRIHALVFVMPSRDIEVIAAALNHSLNEHFGTNGVNFVVGLSNNMSIVHRRDAMKRFREGDASVLVGTDVAARGLDIPDLSHVFHFDLPTDPDAYLHRAGRTGRQGRDGNSIVLITSEEHFVIRRTANALGISFHRIGRSS